MSFIGNPILKSVNATSPDGDVTFHRVIADITIGGEAFRQSRPVAKKGQAVTFDIAPAMRAYASRFEYAPVVDSASYEPIVASVSVHDEFMRDGVLIKTTSVVVGSFTGEIGEYNDMELITNNKGFAHTLKPSDSPQLIAAPSSFIFTSGRNSNAISFSDEDIHKHKSLGGIDSYIIPITSGVVQFQFVNSRGMVESIHAFCRMSEDSQGDSADYVRNMPETLGQPMRRMTLHKDRYGSFTVSSGFCSLSWARWWAYEFCQSDHVWMLIDSSWIPCNVKIKSGSIIDASKPALLHVEFIATPAVNSMII